MTIIAMMMVLLFLICVFRNYWWLMIKARRYGNETEAAVCRIEREKKTAFGSGSEHVMSYYYVVFRRQDGLQAEARLLNPKGLLSVGSRIRIRYLEEKNNCAVLNEIMEL